MGVYGGVDEQSVIEMVRGTSSLTWLPLWGMIVLSYPCSTFLLVAELTIYHPDILHLVYLFTLVDMECV